MYRQIHTFMWKGDDWFLGLEPQEKLLFIYLFSNELTTIAGIYRLPLPVIAFETGMDKQSITTMLDKFAMDGKVYYENGVAWVVNMRKYQANASPKVQKKIELELQHVPDCALKQKYLQFYDGGESVGILGDGDNDGAIRYPYGMDKVRIPLATATVTDTVTDTVLRDTVSAPASIGDLVAYYETNSGRMVAEKAKDDLAEILAKHVTWDVLCEAERIATERGKTVANGQRWGYLMGIIRREIDGTARKSNSPPSAPVRASPGATPSNIVVWG